MTYPDRFTHQLALIQPAHGLKSEYAIPLTVGKHKPDFVHVSGEHHAQAILVIVLTVISTGFRASFGDQHISQGINFHLIGVRTNLL